MPPVRPIRALRAALLSALLSLVTNWSPAHAAPTLVPVSPLTASPTPGPAVLALTAVAGFRHDSIPNATALFRTHAMNRRWRMTLSDNVTQVFEAGGSLRSFDVVVFLLTSGDIFSPTQMQTFEQYVREGGAVVGVHSAIDTHRGWPFYRDMLGAVLAGHPPVQWADVNVTQSNHSTTGGLPRSWRVLDEFYNFMEPFSVDGKDVLVSVDESSYDGGAHGAVHPVTWTRRIAPSQARVWVTVLGHTREMYSSAEGYARLFQTHIALGVEWAANGTRASRTRWREAMADLIA